MNGPDHYRQAAVIAGWESLAGSPDERSVPYLLLALTHAVQANTAAIIDSRAGGRWEPWLAALDTQPATSEGDPA